MSNFFARQVLKYRNAINQSCAELVGIAEGLLCDGHLNDQEVVYLQRWLDQHEAIASEWPGDLLHARVQAALADGQVSDEERADLVGTLQKILGGRIDDLAAQPRVAALDFDEPNPLRVHGALLVLTGEFVFAPRERCIQEIAKLGGTVKGGVTKKTNYLLVGSLGSEEWKHGTFGTKIEKALRYREDGCGIQIVHEDHWVHTLPGASPG